MNKLDEMTNFIETITEYTCTASGLEMTSQNSELRITQDTDGKSILFSKVHISDVLERVDSDGKRFLQVNFIDGKKILITDKLIGFKPAECQGIDVGKLPKVVTTPDLLSVIEAIEDSMRKGVTFQEEVDVLRKVFHSVIEGAEAVGFTLEEEKHWLDYLVVSDSPATA